MKSQIGEGFSMGRVGMTLRSRNLVRTIQKRGLCVLRCRELIVG